MKFEAIEPSHRTQPPLSYTFKDLVHMNTLVPAYAKQCAVDKADPGAFPHTASLHKENERITTVLSSSVNRLYATVFGNMSVICSLTSLI